MDDIAVGTSKVVTSRLLEQGFLGLLCLISMAAACFFYLEKRKGEKRERELYERNAAKAEKWIEKYNEHARDMREVIASLVRKV
jgi:hypothetical protein